MLDRRLVGRTTAPGKNLVERGAVRRFAEAIGEDHPVHRSERAARALGYPGIIAPPTFAQSSAQFDPEYFLRPKVGQPWFGSGREPTGGGGR